MILSPELRRPLSEVQAAILRCVVESTEATGYQPSLAEIAALMKLSVQVIHYQLRQIAGLGWIDMRGQARGILIAPDVRAELTARQATEIETSAVSEMEVR